MAVSAGTGNGKRRASSTPDVDGPAPGTGWLPGNSSRNSWKPTSTWRWPFMSGVEEGRAFRFPRAGRHRHRADGIIRSTGAWPIPLPSWAHGRRLGPRAGRVRALLAGPPDWPTASSTRFGRALHITPERRERAERWIHRYEVPAIVIGRLIPGFSESSSPSWPGPPAPASGSFCRPARALGADLGGHLHGHRLGVWGDQYQRVASAVEADPPRRVRASCWAGRGGGWRPGCVSGFRRRLFRTDHGYTKPWPWWAIPRRPPP